MTMKSFEMDFEYCSRRPVISHRWLRHKRTIARYSSSKPVLSFRYSCHPSEFAKGSPIDRDALRDRLRKMSNKELREFGKASAHVCSPETNMGKAPRQDLVTQLEEARLEWKRRMKR